MRLVVDGGGTKTRACLVTHSEDPPRVVGEGHAGGSNPTALGIEPAMQQVGAAIEQACRAAAPADSRIGEAVIALAGAGQTEIRKQVEAWCRSHGIANSITVTTDIGLILECVSAPTCVILASGTGSFSVARDPTGTTHRCGGFGYLVGDEGSGYWIAAEAIKEATRQSESKSRVSTVESALCRVTATNDLRGLVGKIHAATDPRSALAELCPVVIELAAQGEAISNDVVARASWELARLATSAAEKLGGSDVPIPLYLTGGVLVHARALREAVLAELDSESIDFGPVRTIDNPARSAAEKLVRLEIHLADEVEDVEPGAGPEAREHNP